MPKVLVLGGTGFLGRKICLEALNAGYSVTSVSRKGIEGLKSHDSINPSWISQIQWKSGDIFNPKTFHEDLKSADAVVHTVGTAFGDQQYKNLLIKPSISGLFQFGSSQLAERFRGSNPMKVEDEFDRVNCKSAVLAAKEYISVSEPPSRKSFIYISSENWNPLLSPRYVESKRQAESGLSSIADLRTVFVRPGLIYDGNVRDIRSTLACAMSNIPFLVTPLTSQTVARAVVEACKDESIEGVISWKALERFSQVSHS
jgi:NAD(P)-dependent dehydrogenase (short-subunit alcohol dehydrogenase family)